MRKKIDPVVDEAIETLNMKDGPSRRSRTDWYGSFPWPGEIMPHR